MIEIRLKQIIKCIEERAPLMYQESYDNAGLITGDRNHVINSALVSLDVTEEVIDEAIEKECNLIIAHHPIVFGGLKSFTGRNYIERCIIKAIKNDIAIYASHTNLDSVPGGVNEKICQKLNLANYKVLDPIKNRLKKLVVFVPENHAEKVRDAMFQAGAGSIGEYDFCSFNTSGDGTFRAGGRSNPFVGKKGEIHTEKEIRIETIFPNHVQGAVVSNMVNSHPYEEVAYDIYPIENKNPQIGIGMVGELTEAIDEKEFLTVLKNTFHCQAIKHTSFLNKKIKKVAVVGGAGSFLLNKAISAKADVFVTGDFKYHQFFDAENKILIADIGHYESEQFTKEVFYEIVKNNFPNFAVCISSVNTNPVSVFV